MVQKLLLLIAFAVALGACGPDDGAVSMGDLSELATGDMRTFEFHSAPQPGSTEAFIDEDRFATRIADFEGKVLLINIWATWCAPCIREMPQLDALSQEFAGEDFALIAISTDRLVDGRMSFDDVKMFLNEDIGATHIPLYTDWPINFALSSGISVWPTTILYGRDGQELGRINGPAEWDSDDARAMIEGVIEATHEQGSRE